METHSSIRAWRIPRTEEPGGLQSMGSQIVRHDWATNTHIHLLIVGQLLYSVVMAFAIHQHEWAIGIHMSPPSHSPFPQPSPSHPSMLSQSTGFGFHRVDFYLSILWSFLQPIFSVEQAWLQSLQVVSGLGCWREKYLSSDLFTDPQLHKSKPRRNAKLLFF